MKLLIFAGSLRAGSFNKKLAKRAAAIAKAKGAEVTYIDLSDYPMNIYNADDEERDGLPENAKRVKKMMVEADGFVIATPEYNSSITAALKNTLDWASRFEEGDENQLIAYKGKVAALISASPGYLGGLRSLTHLRALLQNVGVTVIPDHLTLPKANEAFDESDQLVDEKKEQKLERIVKNLLSHL